MFNNRLAFNLIQEDQHEDKVTYIASKKAE